MTDAETRSMKPHTGTFPAVGRRGQIIGHTGAFPPVRRRGQITEKILEDLAVKVWSIVAGFGGKNTEIPNGCNSDPSSRLMTESNLTSEVVIPGSVTT
ncbi:hypothetical protein FH972_011396 [Carpinus fangiana]|uniref:Uncharacterized protein n=1 Tax=Carpinus fangiana TaxID=176857 RepID=A0A660KT22_9ROSI|nr:hypothetical protein FH972_011396 [Carpinus fangiana]